MKKRLAAALCFLFAAAHLLPGCVQIRMAGPSKTLPVETAAPAVETTSLGSAPEPGVRIAPLPVGVPYTGDGGLTLTIAEKAGTPDMGDSEITLTALVGGRETAVKAEGFFKSAYYIGTPGGACVVLSVDESGAELYRTYVYALGGGSLAQSGKADGYVTRIGSNPGERTVSAILCKWIDILGSYRACHEHTLNAEFVLEPAGDGLWHVLEDDAYQETIEYYTLTTTREIPVQALVDGQYKDTTLGPDKDIRVTAWDEGNTVYFLSAADGSAGRFFVTLDKDTEEWGRAYLIDGVPEFDCFEELPYAG